MTDDMIPLFAFPAIEGKKVTAAFDGGRMSSDGGVMLLSMAERRLGVAERLARCIPDQCDRSRIAHTIADMIRGRKTIDEFQARLKRQSRWSAEASGNY